MRIKSSFLCCLLLFISVITLAHPMPASQLLMNVDSKDIRAELHLPLGELQLALGDIKDVSANTESLVARDSPWLSNYVLRHIHATSSDGRAWQITIDKMNIQQGEQEGTGIYKQLCINLRMTPPAGSSVRAFTLRYDAIMHQLVTHKALVSVQDWSAGRIGEDGQVQIGYFSVNPKDNSIEPLQVLLDEGSNWKGFMRMVSLGIEHISEGTDHLLFLLVLLLPAPLIVRRSKWAEAGTTRYAALRLISIATAFTIGHSLTLVAGAMGWLRLPQQPVEILIAVSILVTAVHAIRPLFPGRESLFAAGFGLVHGLAFATVLAGLHLEGSHMAISILGFNIGIELMQLFVMLLTAPWLLMLSVGRWYGGIRIGGAAIAGVSAIAWIVERISRTTTVESSIQRVATYGKWIVLALACCAVLNYFISKRQNDTIVVKLRRL